MNTALFNSMINRYNALAFTHNYIYGFCFKGNIYMVETDETVMPYILKLDKASRGAGYSLRFCPTNEQKAYMLSMGATVICSKEFFDETVANSKYNKGEIFEKMVTEIFGQRWEKDNVPFTQGGDLSAYGVDYQIKFERATFTNEKSLSNLA